MSDQQLVDGTGKTMKKNLTLNLNHKKNDLTLPLQNNAMLLSPDLNMLKVGTPELENMILNQDLPNTPTPSLLFPRNVTEEQETFSAGFMQALNNLHNSNSQHGSDSNASTVYNSNEPTSFMPLIKEEPQTVPNIGSSPPLSPVDMEYQERIKLERKRQRNRLAASKCRSRKLERISKLEDKVKQLKTENVELAGVVAQLKEHVGLLKLEVLEHVHAGCPIMNQY